MSGVICAKSRKIGERNDARYGKTEEDTYDLEVIMYKVMKKLEGRQAKERAVRSG